MSTLKKEVSKESMRQKASAIMSNSTARGEKGDPKVAACIRSSSGELYVGVEVRAGHDAGLFTALVHAENAAVCSMVTAEGKEAEIVEMVVVGRPISYGDTLQFLSGFIPEGSKACLHYYSNPQKKDDCKTYTMDQLLPENPRGISIGGISL